MKASVSHAACIQRIWKGYYSSPQRASRLAAIVKIQAHVRAGRARHHAKHLRQQRAAVAAINAAMRSGSRAQLQAAAAQLVQAGVLKSTACPSTKLTAPMGSTEGMLTCSVLLCCIGAATRHSFGSVAECFGFVTSLSLHEKVMSCMGFCLT